MTNSELYEHFSGIIHDELMPRIVELERETTQLQAENRVLLRWLAILYYTHNHFPDQEWDFNAGTAEWSSKFNAEIKQEVENSDLADIPF